MGCWRRRRQLSRYVTMPAPVNKGLHPSRAAMWQLGIVNGSPCRWSKATQSLCTERWRLRIACPGRLPSALGRGRNRKKEFPKLMILLDWHHLAVEKVRPSPTKQAAQPTFVGRGALSRVVGDLLPGANQRSSQFASIPSTAAPPLQPGGGSGGGRCCTPVLPRGWRDPQHLHSLIFQPSLIRV